MLLVCEQFLDHVWHHEDKALFLLPPHKYSPLCTGDPDKNPAVSRVCGTSMISCDDTGQETSFSRVHLEPTDWALGHSLIKKLTRLFYSKNPLQTNQQQKNNTTKKANRRIQGNFYLGLQLCNLILTTCSLLPLHSLQDAFLQYLFSMFLLPQLFLSCILSGLLLVRTLSFLDLMLGPHCLTGTILVL